VAFSRDIAVRFPDVDFARVVYYPRFFDFAHQVMEDFFAAEVGVSYAVMLRDRKVGFPTVHCEADFKAPLRFGDVARLELGCDRASERSVALRYRVTRVEGLVHCATLQVVTVPVAMDTFTAVAVPADVRAAFARHVAGA
jgi:4-hydroxybenzoyl-CoA thioesterase